MSGLRRHRAITPVEDPTDPNLATLVAGILGITNLAGAVVFHAGYGITAPANVSRFKSITHPTAIFEQDTEGSRPTFTADLSSLGPHLSTDGAKFMQLNAAGIALLPATDNYSVIAVCNTDGAAGFNYLFSISTSVSANAIIFYNAGSSANDPQVAAETRSSGQKLSTNLNPTPLAVRQRGGIFTRNSAVKSFESETISDTGDASQNVTRPAATAMTMFGLADGTSGWSGVLQALILVPTVAIDADDLAELKPLFDTYRDTFGGTSDV